MSLVYEHKLDGALYRIYSEKPEFDLFEINQVHGTNILNTRNSTPLLEADGLICHLDYKIPLAIKTADCLPIAVTGENGFANLHAGWRGLHKNIFSNPLLKKIKPKVFFIGPAIQQEDYQIKRDFLEYFPQFPDSFDCNAKKLTFSLQKTAEKLIHSEFENAKIVVSKINTFDHEFLHSYRRNQTQKRNWNVLIPGL